MVLQDYNDNCGALHIAGVSVLNSGLYFEVFKYNVFIAKDKYVVANMQKGIKMADSSHGRDILAHVVQISQSH